MFIYFLKTFEILDYAARNRIFEIIVVLFLEDVASEFIEAGGVRAG